VEFSASFGLVDGSVHGLFGRVGRWCILCVIEDFGYGWYCCCGARIRVPFSLLMLLDLLVGLSRPRSRIRESFLLIKKRRV
jgi:hypothetical protein